MNLFIFPHAGGFANYYLPLKKISIETISSVNIYEYAQRNSGCGIPAPKTFDELTDQVISFVLSHCDNSQPFLFFGHSMGAFVAYETAVKMKNLQLSTPEILFLSGQRPPCTVEEGYFSSDPTVALPYLEGLSGLDNLKNINERVRKFFIDIILYDLRLLETYKPTVPKEDDLLNKCVLIHGDQDPELKNRDLSLWNRHFETIQNDYIFHGGHFYLEHHWGDIAGIILNETKKLNLINR